MSKKNVSLVGLLMAFVLAVSPCTPARRCVLQPKSPDLPISPVDSRRRKAEGAIVTYGLPNSWVNYGGLFAGVHPGIRHYPPGYRNGQRHDHFYPER